MNFSDAHASMFAIAASGFGLTILFLAILAKTLPQHAFAAQQTSRSNHQRPARQIGGLAAVPAAAIAAAAYWPQAAFAPTVAFAAATALAFATGVTDDLRDLGAMPKLLLQLLASGAAALALMSANTTVWNASALAALAVATVGIAYWTNVANFMDGIDLMEVVGLGLPLACVSIMLLQAEAGQPAYGVAGLALAGALAGFALFNRPPASVFLGDGGSLVCGLVSSCVILAAAAGTSAAAAAIPFLYFACDATSTLVLRLRGGENILTAHSSHAYQIARRAGIPVPAIIARVAMLNGFLCVLSWVASQSGPVAGAMSLTAGVAATMATIFLFRRTGR